MSNSELVSAKQFADRLGCSIPTLMTMIEEKRVPRPLPRKKPTGSGRGKRGGRIYFKAEDVDRFFEPKNKASAINSELRDEIKSLLREVLREEGLA